MTSEDATPVGSQPKPRKRQGAASRTAAAKTTAAKTAASRTPASRTSAAKPRETRYTGTDRATHAATEGLAPAPGSKVVPGRAGADRRERIAQAAYYLAEQRGFAAGHEEEDWLLAERRIDDEQPDSPGTERPTGG